MACLADHTVIRLVGLTYQKSSFFITLAGKVVFKMLKVIGYLNHSMLIK